MFTAAISALIAATACLASVAFETCGTSASIDARQYQPDEIVRHVVEGASLSNEDAKALEESLLADPNNVSTRARLLGYYYYKGEDEIGVEAARAARLPHILWIIEHHPDSPAAAHHASRINIKDVPLADAEGFAGARELWLRQAAKYGNNPKVLWNAITFLAMHDKPSAETLLRRGQALEPLNSRWPESLGRLYALGILRIDALTVNSLPASLDTAAGSSDFAARATTILNEEWNGHLLHRAGQLLYSYGGLVIREKGSRAEVYMLAESCLFRALESDFDNRDFIETLVDYYMMRSKYSEIPDEKQFYAVQALRFHEKLLAMDRKPFKLRNNALIAFEAGQIEKAESYALQVMAYIEDLPEEARNRPTEMIHYTNLVLGRIALRRGDIDSAKEHLLAAGRLSAEWAGGILDTFGPNMTLAKELLERGEREVVIEYLELCRTFWKSHGERLLNQWIDEIKSGDMPQFGANLIYGPI